MGYVSTPAGQVVGVVPDANEDPNLPLDLLNIAKALEKRVVGVYATTAARDSATVAAGVEEGMFAFTKDADKLWYYTGSAWVAFPPAQPAITSGTSVPSAASGANGDIFFKV
jgi:hypothetical protein